MTNKEELIRLAVGLNVGDGVGVIITTLNNIYKVIISYNPVVKF
jgi:hypothetical protein